MPRLCWATTDTLIVRALVYALDRHNCRALVLVAKRVPHTTLAAADNSPARGPAATATTERRSWAGCDDPKGQPI